MTIKSNDHEYNVTGVGQGTYNTIAGSLGLASFLGFNAGNNGIFGRSASSGATGTCNEDHVATRYDLDMIQQLMAKDERIALLESENNTNNKMVDVFERLSSRIRDVENTVRANRDEQLAINAQQGIYNATANASIAVLQSQVASLLSLTKMVVPAANVCPQPMPQYNSWTAPTTTTTNA